MNSKLEIIFIHATWSGYSLMGLSHIQDFVKDYPQIHLRVIDVDSDEFKEFSKEYNFKSHGNGETFWMKNGEVLNSIRHCIDEKDKVAEFTKTLVNAESPSNKEENTEWLMSLINGIPELKQVQEQNVIFIGSSNELIEDIDKIKKAECDVRMDLYHYIILKEENAKYLISIFDPIELWDNARLINRVEL